MSDQMEAHLHDGSTPHMNPRLEPLADDFITEAMDLADFDAEAADSREERVLALRRTMQVGTGEECINQLVYYLLLPIA